MRRRTVPVSAWFLAISRMVQRFAWGGTWLVAAIPGWAEDTVVISREDGQSESRRTGEILDYTGDSLTLQVAGGRKEQIPAARVVSFEITKVPDHLNADQLYSEGRFADAVVSYRRAVESDSRTWVRRLILSQMTWCYRNMAQFDRAGETFLILLRSDPSTPWYGTIPLPWKSSQQAGELVQQATRWMADSKVPTASLLGASWLLATAQREQALKTLGQLTSCPDPRVALLAEAQQWRGAVVTASLADVQRWEQQVGRLDASLQAGPWYVVGQGLARHNQYAHAALAFLRVPILYPDDRDLAAESLLAAGEQLEKAGDPAGARNVYRELIQHAPQHALVPVAEQHLEQLPRK
ncbi:MAG: tetratricopeptide repeat protein [Pirellulaceae bacterium]